MTFSTPITIDTDTVPCRRDPERQFPVGHGSAREAQEHAAKTVCRRGDNGRACPLIDRCLRFALRHAVEGVWGATTAEERQAIRARTGVEAIPLYAHFREAS